MSNGKISFYLRKDIHDEHIIFINSEVRYPLNEWMFIAAVREKGVFSLYLNGKRVGALKDPYFENQILANMQNLILGSSSNSELVLNGKIDDFRLYHKALKSSEIKMLFNENKY